MCQRTGDPDGCGEKNYFSKEKVDQAGEHTRDLFFFAYYIITLLPKNVLLTYSSVVKST
jgi:hypothetical protein